MNMPRQQNISRNIVLVTDGYISGEQGVFDYIRSNLNQSNVFAFGIGTAVNRYLIEGVAKAGMGEPFIVSQESEAGAVAEKFRSYIQTPVLTNIRVRSVGFDTYDVDPVSFPDLLAQRPLILFGKWRGPVTGMFELTGQSGRGEYVSRLDISGQQPEEGNSALRYLWARSRIAELSDYGSNDVSDDHVREITSLGLKYNLLTRYTSFIAVREVVTNTLEPAKDINQPVPLPLHVTDMAVGDATEEGAEPELIWLLVISALVVTITIIRKQRRFV
jgi:Ca-activated chloride channel family protein